MYSFQCVRHSNCALCKEGGQSAQTNASREDWFKGFKSTSLRVVFTSCRRSWTRISLMMFKHDVARMRRVLSPFPRASFFGVMELRAEEMLLEAVPLIPRDARELQEVRAIDSQRRRFIALCAEVSRT